MQNHHSLVTPLIIFSLFLILLPHTHSNPCPAVSCNRHRRDTVQFPFWIPANQTRRCGYPGFSLSCNSDDTLLTLPSHPSAPFRVRAIDYADQIIWLSDTAGCVPSRVLSLNLTASPYASGPDTAEYSFLNCSKQAVPTNPDLLPVGSSVVSCMSRDNFTVVSTFEKASEEKMRTEWKCKVINKVNAPLWWQEFGYGYYPKDMSDVFIQLSWDVPGCGDCSLRDGDCGFIDGSNNNLAVGCFLTGGNGGLPRGAQVGLILGAGIPGVICMIALTFYISGRVRSSNNQNRSRSNTESSLAIFPQPFTITLGLDRPTIESYPQTVLGESKRLPRPSDGTCPICLSEYQPKETLRSIPECNHFFHAECIDEWLRLNATCPLCRKSPPKSSAGAGS